MWLVSLPVWASSPDSLQQIQGRQSGQIDSFIRTLHQRGYFNGSLLVAQNGKILVHTSLGLANLDGSDSIRNEYPFQMASVSKPVTASAIMLLYQRGEISLDDKIVKYFPELMMYHKVTIRHLLNHTSGIPEYIYKSSVWWQSDNYMTNDDLLEFLSKKRYKLEFVPGRKFHYCNTNYALLASLVERVTEQKFDEFVQQEIFKPLGMDHSVIFNPGKDTLSCRLIKGYYWNGRRFVEYNYDYRNGVMGDKGLFSTADDMMRFAVAFSDESIWCRETCQEIFTKTPLYGPYESEYGAGWRMREWDGRKVVLHYGFWNSFRTGLIHFPESGVTFVILNNLTGAKNSRINNREYIINELMAIMFPVSPVTPSEPVLAGEEMQSPVDVPENPAEGEGESQD